MKSNSPLQPIFLIGAGRSGTKFLRSLLNASEEIESIPYDVGYVWRYGNEDLAHDELTPAMSNIKIKAYIRDTLPKLTETRKPKANFFLEKSVPNTLRPSFLFDIYPEAKFIHLIRDGRAVTESAIRLWQEPADKKYLLKKLKYFPWSNYKYAFWYLSNMVKGALSGARTQHIWGPRYKGMDTDASTLPIEIVCARQWKRSVEIAREQLKEVPGDQIIEIRYEDLMKDKDTLLRICTFLGLSDSDKVTKKFQETAQKSNLDKWKQEISPITLSKINTEIGSVLTDLGYE